MAQHFVELVRWEHLPDSYTQKLLSSKVRDVMKQKQAYGEYE